MGSVGWLNDSVGRQILKIGGFLSHHFVFVQLGSTIL